MENGSLDRAPPKKQPGNPAWEPSCSRGRAGSSSKAPLPRKYLLHGRQHRAGLPLTTYAEPWRVLPRCLDLYRGLSTISRHKGDQNCDNTVETGRSFQKILLRRHPSAQCSVGNPLSSLTAMSEAVDRPRIGVLMTNFPLYSCVLNAVLHHSVIL